MLKTPKNAGNTNNWEMEKTESVRGCHFGRGGVVRETEPRLPRCDPIA